MKAIISVLVLLAAAMVSASRTPFGGHPGELRLNSKALPGFYDQLHVGVFIHHVARTGSLFKIQDLNHQLPSVPQNSSTFVRWQNCQSLTKAFASLQSLYASKS